MKGSMATGYYKRNFEQQQQGYDTVQLRTNRWCCTKYDWNDDNMRRHTEAEASVLFGKPTSPFSPSMLAPLSKGGVLYGPMYLDEVRWKLYQGEEDRRTKTTQTRPLAGMSNEQSIELMRIFHHKSYITDPRSMTPTIYGVWSGTTYDRIQQDRRKCKNVNYAYKM